MISCFLASETGSKADFKNYRKQKKGKPKIKTKISNLKGGKNFSYQRLLAIYASINGYFNYDEDKKHETGMIISEFHDYRVNYVEVVMDLNSLVEIDLIKLHKSSEQNFILNRKMIINFDSNFITKVAGKVGSKIEELITIN